MEGIRPSSALTRHSIYSGGSAVRELLNELADLGAAPAARIILRPSGGPGVEGPAEGESLPDVPSITVTYIYMVSQRKVSEFVKSLPLLNFHVEPGGGRPQLLLGLSSPLAISSASPEAAEPLARTQRSAAGGSCL